jgi:predicted ester cyclase
MTTMDRARVDAMIDRPFRFEVEDDVEGVLSTMHADVEHDVVGSPLGPLLGHDAARGFYRQLFADLSGEKITTLRRYYGEGFAVDESLWEGTAPGTPLGIPGDGKPVAFRILHVLEFDADAQIKRENVWLDFGAIVRQLSGPAQ